MIPLCFVHLGDQPGHGQLMAGDVTLLERLLPGNQVVQRFELGQRVRLTLSEGQSLLECLQKLDAGSECYYRSVTGQVTGTACNLIESLIQFLIDELGFATG